MKKISEKLRTAFLILVAALGIVMIFNKPIRNKVIEGKTREHQVSNTSQDEIAENASIAEENAVYDFDNVQPLSLEAAVSAQLESPSLPTVGGVAVPELGINLPIFLGLGNTELTYGAGTMKENQKMGKGNYALASHHVFGIYGSTNLLFSPLERAQSGMEILTTDLENIYTYTITSVSVVDPTAVYVIDDQDGVNEITLVTCTDAEATKRTVVKGELSKITPMDNATETQLHAFGINYNI